MGSFDYKPSYRRNLPHIQPAGATFFLTFRLAGSLPQSIVDQWKQEREWLEPLRQSNPFHYDRVKLDFERKWFAKFESVLDGSTHGPVWLRDDRIAGYDHYVRNAEEWNRIIAYVLNNPVKARYVADWRDWKWNYRRE